MTIFDEARTLDSMMKMCNMTQGELAEKLGVSQSYIANKLRLLSYSPEAEAMIVDGKLSGRHARAILSLETEEERLSAIRKTVERSFTVRECEALVDFMRSDAAPRSVRLAPAAERIHKFSDVLDESVKALRSLGVDITRRTSYHGKRTYIMLCINEG